MLYWSSRSCSWTWNDPDCLLFMAWSCFSLTFPSPAWHLFCFSFFLLEMNEQDIRYRDILGHGNGGTVYKWVRISLEIGGKMELNMVWTLWGIGGALVVCGREILDRNSESILRVGCFIVVLILSGWGVNGSQAGVWMSWRSRNWLQDLEFLLEFPSWEWPQWDWGGR